MANETNVKDPTVSPLQASIEQLNGLPPALILPVTAVRYHGTIHGTIHDFVMLNMITDDPAPRAAIDQASFTLKKILTK